jgi:hypothetical protein
VRRPWLAKAMFTHPACFPPSDVGLSMKGTMPYAKPHKAGGVDTKVEHRYLNSAAARLGGTFWPEQALRPCSLLSYITMRNSPHVMLLC